MRYDRRWRATAPVDSVVFGRRSNERKRRPKHSVNVAHPLASKSRDQSRRARTGNSSRHQQRLHSPLSTLHASYRLHYTEQAWQRTKEKRELGIPKNNLQFVFGSSHAC